jgi:transcriptional regulator with XRE-family HTH domain
MCNNPECCPLAAAKEKAEARRSAAACCASSFGERLKKAMEMHCMTQVEFAEKSGTRPMEINHWVSGRREPSIANLARLLKALPNTRIDWLITGENLQHNVQAMASADTQTPKENGQP